MLALARGMELEILVVVHVFRIGHAMKKMVQSGTILGESYDSSKFYCIICSSSFFHIFFSCHLSCTCSLGGEAVCAYAFPTSRIGDRSW